MTTSNIETRTLWSPGSVGIVEQQYFTFAEDEPFPLESGATLGPVTVAYETYGRLNADRSNAILICHALSGSGHAAGYHAADDAKPGWWDDCIGPGQGVRHGPLLRHLQQRDRQLLRLHRAHVHRAGDGCAVRDCASRW